MSGLAGSPEGRKHLSETVGESRKSPYLKEPTQQSTPAGDPRLPRLLSKRETEVAVRERSIAYKQAQAAKMAKQKVDTPTTAPKRKWVSGRTELAMAQNESTRRNVR